MIINDHICTNCANSYMNREGNKGCWATEEGNPNLNMWIFKNWNYQKQQCVPGACNCPAWKKQISDN